MSFAVTSSIRAVMTSMTSSNPFSFTSLLVCLVIPEASTAYTFRAPARAANMLKIPVPHPTSSTTLPFNASA
jgi:hypothetical protein